MQERDPGYFAGERRLAETLAELQDVYLLRLDYALRAVYAVQRRASGDAGAGPAAAALAGAVAEAVAAVRELDAAHLRQVNNARGEFFQRLQPHARPVMILMCELHPDGAVRGVTAGLPPPSLIMGGEVRPVPLFTSMI